MKYKNAIGEVRNGGRIMMGIFNKGICIGICYIAQG